MYFTFAMHEALTKSFIIAIQSITGYVILLEIEGVMLITSYR